LKPLYASQDSTRSDFASSPPHVDHFNCRAIATRPLLRSCTLGVVLLRKPLVNAKMQVLMIQRGNPPAYASWKQL
jgi:hypothetical protein